MSHAVRTVAVVAALVLAGCSSGEERPGEPTAAGCAMLGDAIAERDTERLEAAETWASNQDAASLERATKVAAFAVGEGSWDDARAVWITECQ